MLIWVYPVRLCSFVGFALLWLTLMFERFMYRLTTCINGYLFNTVGSNPAFIIVQLLNEPQHDKSDQSHQTSLSA